jgi:hypothetical protein
VVLQIVFSDFSEFNPIFSRVLRDSISRYVGRSVGRSVGPSTVSVAVSPHATLVVDLV